MSILNRTIITVLAFAFIQGCASQPETLSQVYDRFEEEDYTNWEKDVAYIERMEAEYHGSLAAHLINSYDEYGKPLDGEYIENTLGFKTHEKAFIVASLFTPLTKLSIASLLAMNSDSPSFGSPEYATQYVYRRNVTQMSDNTHFFSTSLDPTDLPTYQNTVPQSKHHELHLKAKYAFKTGLDSALNEFRKQGVDCTVKGYNPDKHGSNYAYSRVQIKPMQQYETVYNCNTKGKNHIVIMSTYIVRNNKNGHKIINALSFSHLDDIKNINPQPVIDQPLWGGTMSTCKTCSPDLDRLVRISSNNQDKDWVKEFEKGSLYSSSN